MEKEIFFDARMLMHSGIGTYIKNLLRFLKDAPFRWKILIPPSLLDAFPWLKHYTLIPFSAPIYSVQEQLLLPLVISSCAVFWSPHFNVPVFPIKAKKRLVTIHDAYHLAYFSRLRLMEKLYAKYMVPFAARKAHKIITVSQFSKNEIEKYTQANSEKIAVIYPGVDSDLFSQQKEEEKIEVVKKKYSLPEKYILYVGSEKYHKNLAGLLEAMLLLLSEGKERCSLVVVGKKERILQNPTLSSLLTKNPILLQAISFVGFIEDSLLPVFYQLAQMTVIPSFYEGFGSPSMEAMQCGCPVVAAKVASLPEVCKHTVQYVNPHLPKDIARGIRNILSDSGLKERLKGKGIQRSREFCWKKAAQEHVYLIEKLCFEKDSS